MKISVITPIYNEEESIQRYFEAINRVKYPHEDFEIVLINDGSTDDSKNILESESEKSPLKTRILNLDTNQGRIIARETAAKNARFENLLFIDCKCEIAPDALLEISKANYQPINGTALQRSNQVYDRLFYLIRESLTKVEYKAKEAYFITEENFDRVSKGTGVFYCDRDTFLNAQPADKRNKFVSDDTRLLWNIVQKMPILKTARIKVVYNTRQSLSENTRHIFKRGPMFVDYYYKPSKPMFWLINLILLGIVTALYAVIANAIYVEAVILLLVMDGMISIFLARNVKDFFICFYLFPLFGTTFLLGIIHGLIARLFQRRY